MKHVFFTPGPAQIYPTIPGHIQTALDADILSLSHRSPEFDTLFHETTEALMTLLSIPKDYRIYFLSSATECMERIIQNSVEKKSFHLVNGAFSERFAEMAKELGRKTGEYRVEMGNGFDFDQVRIPKDAELVCVTHNETSTGVLTNLDAVTNYEFQVTSCLRALDVVSSIPGVAIDFSAFDFVFWSVQKGFGLPAGLGVLVVSPKGFGKAVWLGKRTSIGSYHSIPSLENYRRKLQTPETPNVLGIYLLGKVAKDMIGAGLSRIVEDTHAKAKMLYDFFEKDDRFDLFVQETENRSPTVVVVRPHAGKSPIMKILQKNGLIVGEGYGPMKDTHMRIANFPAVTQEDVARLIQVLNDTSNN